MLFKRKKKEEKKSEELVNFQDNSQETENTDKNEQSNTDINAEKQSDAKQGESHSSEVNFVVVESKDSETKEENKIEASNQNSSVDSEKSQDDGSHNSDEQNTESQNENEENQEQSEEEKAVKASIIEDSFASKIFSYLAILAFAFPVLIVAAQSYLGLDVRHLWVDQARHAAVYNAMIESSNWLILHLNNNLYAENPPLYYWFLYLVDQIPYFEKDNLFFIGSTISVILLVVSTWLLAISLGFNRKISFGASLILVSTFSFFAVSEFTSINSLFASLIILSQLFLYRGWIKESGFLYLALGFIFAVLACLTNGVLGILIPIASSIVFLVWRGTFRRAGSRDGAISFGIMLVLLLIYGSLIALQDGGKEYLELMLGRYTFEQFIDAWQYKAAWWYYFATMPLALLPWILTIPFLAWHKLPSALKNIFKARIDNHGTGFAIIACLTGFAILSSISAKQIIYALPLLPFASILISKAILTMSEKRSSLFFALLSVLMLIMAFVLGIAYAFPFLNPILPDMVTELLANPKYEFILSIINNISDLYILALLCLVFAFILLRLTKRNCPSGALLVFCLFISSLSLPSSAILVPSLDSLFSPYQSSEVMKKYVAMDYEPISLMNKAGIYTYYMDNKINEIDSWEKLKDRMDKKGRLVVGTSEKTWKEWQTKKEIYPQECHVRFTQWLDCDKYVVLECIRPQNSPAPERTESPVVEPPSIQSPIAEPKNDASGVEKNDTPVENKGNLEDKEKNIESESGTITEF